MTTPRRVVSAEDYALQMAIQKVDKLETDMNEVMTKYDVGDLQTKLEAASETLENLAVAVDLTKITKHVVDVMYPIGSVMFRTDSVNPSLQTSMDHQTWVQLSAGRYIKTASSSGGSMGGSSTTGSTSVSTTGSSQNTESTTLTAAQMPKHNHTVTSTSAGGCTGKFTVERRWSDGTSGLASINPPGASYDIASGSAIKFSAYDINLTIPSHTHGMTCGETGSSTGHTHPIGALSCGSHTHTIEPTFIQLIVWQRTA